MTAPTIYYVHHGETEWNRAHRYQGRMDSPLTAEGRRQTERIAALLARETAGVRELALVSSPLGRALATARILAAALDLSIITDQRLAEVSLGVWEGLTREEIAARHPTALVGASRWDWYFRAPGGESVAMASARLGAWLAAVRQPTIAVGHGVAGRLLRGLYARLDSAEALRQPVSRDGLFILRAGGITFRAIEGADNG
ncbi:MAG TPA: histidine phosphatase family protein [Stellaceae bacterium]|nr:histidine phosphatase family protein [Stellaceae bacterium]